MMRLKQMGCLILVSVVAMLAAGCGGPATTPKQRELHSGKSSGKQATDKSAKKSTPPLTDEVTDGPAIEPEAKDELIGHDAEPGKSTPSPDTPLAKPQRELRIPVVELPPSILAHCLVKVGDPMPEIELPNLAGESASLTSLYGPKATVILFWSTQGAAVQRVMSQQALEDLGPDVLKPFEQHGARVVAIAVRVEDSAARTQAEAAGATFPQMLDREGTGFAKVGTGQFPRVLVLDGQGKIAWFDVQYTRSTRRDLLEAVEFLVHQ